MSDYAQKVNSTNSFYSPQREAILDSLNPLGMEGIEFIEYATSKPQALGQVLELMGFKPIARHRSREVTLYRQGTINVIINAHDPGLSHSTSPTDKPVLAAIALRVRDAAFAYQRALSLGAWAVPTKVEVMELNIPAIHGVGSSRIYFVDRYKEFSIYDVDFIPIPGVEKFPTAQHALKLFGVVQYIGTDRSEDWGEFYSVLFGFATLAPQTKFGILPKGVILQSPCQTFFLQLIEPEVGLVSVEEDERFQRLAFSTPSVFEAVKAFRSLGVEFIESPTVHTEDSGALTKTWLGGVSFELVKQ
jgi:4-hydroxyphenylpyruvate dioxygenase